MPDVKELFKRLGVKNTTIKAGSNVELSPAQKLAVGSVLDVSQQTRFDIATTNF